MVFSYIPIFCIRISDLKYNEQEKNKVGQKKAEKIIQNLQTNKNL